ncbi:UDP-N-acetylglucosamine--N-acetylmuramyl-(pentapeptide) pyrophosphoryl-undecaprenol N-acetylglucosamine transferase [Streptococcus sanguinis]|uniref:UDP-N-acetylglucosamine--N-acetylmuramyl-(Pentapeptide) pyrophosphoryl-undecaprenol N-acetylglucosamine transferase n=1 Tax=Streptococcus sanguinis TaxID=1305 RepID=A0A427ZBW7_STRSA|nr:UDP-N-acetylglucosamine--N-acetylmuramyl-(pentapeptide) pyrophosphoryl-undecaprenol N-acetylglucosamine transferase [Streptococcus sanguinis]RSI11650.1 UDP-N-acetylglucosamine--N-acetylmuramyl-(pentapeptide) pyrophosphoryl-undecaprenol N-acetylglucosamine transferase [Streptococcus sanguinis]RSI26001.1 UDP-N-acetylglucosamine--N-acetylmuramyl-(pentapeptide) pyrophosphoryl-undecaprenol N-acetylglucosamine transferase [Streptococcus sanguinis]RSI32167.1 UDP-N-acetylglucosamine--N-acetylmuramyl-
MKKIVFTGGGTVGHVTLNLLLIPKFIKEGWQVHYVGDKHGIEYQEIQKSGLDVTFHSVATGKLRRYFSWQNLFDGFKVVWGIFQSLGIMLKVRPQALFSKGGFVSVPPVIAARLSGVPVYVHESDLSIGLANKIAYKCATKMYATFEQPSSLTKIEHVGAVTKVGSQESVPPQELEEIRQYFDKELPTLLFVGGSAGAKVFNDFVSQNQAALTEHYNIINLTGDASLDVLSERLFRRAYVTDLYQPLMDLADVVVTRGGSNTIFELLAMAKLHIIVPLGREASRGDQIENADYFVKKGYAKQLAEEQLDMSNLQTALDDLLANQASYHQAMKNSQEIKSVDEFYALLKADIDKGKK